MATSEKVGVFASGSARNPTSLAFVFCLFIFGSQFIQFALFVCSVGCGVCLYWRGEAEPLVYIQALATEYFMKNLCFVVFVEDIS